MELIIFITFFIAILFSVIGLGGAILYTPLFFWLGIPLFTAIPMALLLNAITTASASMTYLRQKIIHTSIAFPIIITSVVGAFTGSYIAPYMNTKILIMLLSGILLFASIRIFFFNNIIIPDRITEKKKKIFSACAGFLIGTMSSLVGVGGGTFIVPLLLVIGLDTKKAVATSSFIVTFISLFGFIGYISFRQQQMDMRILFYTGIAVFIGAQIGSMMIFKHTSSRTIEKMFALILLFMAGKLFYSII